MTREQAVELVKRIMARFPRSYRDAETQGIWADELERHEYTLTVEAITPVVRSRQGDYPPPLNDLKAEISRVAANRQRASEAARLPAPTQREQRTQAARKARKVIEYIFDHGAQPGKWVPHITMREYHQDRAAGIKKPGTKRILDRLHAKYGYGWDDPANWGEDDKGNVIPPKDL